MLVFQKTGDCFGFNSNGQEMFDQDKNGHQITFAYNGSGNLSSLTDTQNRVTTFGYNAKGFINLITDPIGRTVQLSYSNGIPATITDLNGKITKLAYTGTNLSGITDPTSTSTSIYYQTGNASVDHITDALGNTSYYAYYSPGDSQCTSKNIPANEPCSTFKDARGNSTTYGYTGQQVQQVIDANGNLEQSSYTPDANVKLYTDPLLDKTTFNFDGGKSNNLLSTTDGNAGFTQFGYGDTSHPYLPTTINDAQGNQTSYAYDSNGNLTSASDTSKNSTESSASYTYNTSGVSFGSPTYDLLITATDGRGKATQYAYDSEGNLKTVTPPSPLGQESIVVDGVSRVSSVTDGRGNTIQFSYDNLDRLTQITYPSSTITYNYDADGNETSIVDNTGTTSFTYDHDNRLKKKALPDSDVLSVTYDAVGNVSTYTDSGGTVTYISDPANRVTQVQEPDGSLTNYGYNAANEKTSISYPNGTV